MGPALEWTVAPDGRRTTRAPYFALLVLTASSSLLCRNWAVPCLLIRCVPGWTGNRCHVREKVIPSTPTPQMEKTQLGNEAHLAACGSACTAFVMSRAFSMLCSGAVYAGVAIGLLLLLSGLGSCIRALYRTRCYAMWALTLQFVSR